MSTVSNLSNTGLSALRSSSATEAKASGNGALEQEDFLKLMTEQLKAQDPMNPGDTGEFLGQMAQFSSVSGIQSLQQSVESLATSLQSTQALQATSMVGRTVVTEGNSAHLGENGAIEGNFDMPFGATGATLNIINASGETVHSSALSATPGSTESFSWNGVDDEGKQAPEGDYRVEIQALSNGASNALTTRIAGKVESVSMTSGDAGGLMLNIEGAGKVAASAITEMR
ncbi:MAG: flagellar hook assembly protein FlgD [Gammaproteobacteria bacterium]